MPFIHLGLRILDITTLLISSCNFEIFDNPNLDKSPLFDLSKDPAEEHDLSEKNPKIFEKMKVELQKFLDDGRSR